MLDKVALSAALRESLLAITTPRLFETERGYQGALLEQLGRRLRLTAPAIAEQEYQKQMQHHGLRIRPDIIIHEPFDPDRHANRMEGNIAVLELKLRASAADAAEDFRKIGDMIRVLQYPVGFFINVSSTLTYGELIPDDLKECVFPFAASLKDGKAHVHELHR
jgi:hypothetical protein